MNIKVKISRNILKIVSLLTLVIPLLIFNIFFLKWYIGFPLCGCLITALWLYIRNQLHCASINTIFGKKDNDYDIALPALVCCIAVAAAWAYLAGIGGRFTQSNDFHGRNAIFHDLVNHSWPVYIGDGHVALTYYIGYWMIPGLMAKGWALLFGPELMWKFANAVLLLQTIWYLILIFLLFLSLLDRNSHVILLLLLFVLFSGMDGLMCFLKGKWSTHLEFWADDWQYSSNTTCMFWVFNQAVPAWLATLLFVYSIDDYYAYALFGAAVSLHAPFPLIGLFIFCASFFIIHLFRCKGNEQRFIHLKSVFSWCNILSLIAVVPALTYLISNNSVSNEALHIDLYPNKYSRFEFFLTILVFELIEWGMYALMILPRYWKQPAYVISCISLMFIPLFKAGGYYNDFPMRASIPALLILMMYCAHSFINWESDRPKSLILLLAAFLAIGTFTPLTEFKRGIDEYAENEYRPVIRDDYKTVVSELASTNNFVCNDLEGSLFFKYFADVYHP